MTLQQLLRNTAIAVAIALLGSTVAMAGAPQQKTQAPGYYRLMIGDIEVTTLNDGIFPMPVGKLLTNITPEQLDAALSQSFLKDPVDASVNGFLINTGAKLVLVDAGCGTTMGPTVGHLLANLRAAGYQPEQVDEVYITHMHGDHVGGLLADGKAAFPNATVRAAKEEGEFWLSKSAMDAAPEDRKGAFQAAMAALGPYTAAGRYLPFAADTVLVPGVRAVATHGHTPGHTVYVVESKGQRLVLWGDLMHVAAAQFPDPAVTIRFDSDSVAAAAQRRKVFAAAAAGQDWVAGAHLSYPGIGHLRAVDSGYQFVPANYDLVH